MGQLQSDPTAYSASKEVSNAAAQKRWNASAVGQERSSSPVGSPQWYEDLRNYRYGYLHPWLPRVLMHDVQGKDVLEIGVGVGVDATELASRGARYSGIDITRNHLEKAQKHFELRGLPYQAFIEADLTEHHFTQTYDIVYSFGVLHHLAHEDAALRKIHTILKDQGELRVGLYATVSFFNAWMFAMWLLRNRCRMPFNVWQGVLADKSDPDAPITMKVRNKSEIVRLYEQQGFRLKQYHKKGFVQNYLPWLGKHLHPDGVVLNRLGDQLGWFHLLTFVKV